MEVTTGPRISVVVATYDRPDTLRVAVHSALLQTRPPLEVVVVGDACAAETGDTLARIEGPIRYLNLPGRCGEQAIPNSVGAALAEGGLVAFLNHDDVWLPDHLETAFRALAGTGRRWHVGAAAFSPPLTEAMRDSGITFPDRTVEGRSIASAFTRANRYLEPVSSWVVERRLLERVGYWRPARRLYRTPTQDLALRLWRRAGEPSFDDRITVLKLGKAPRRSQQGGERAAYRLPVPGLEDLERRVAEIPAMGDGPLRSTLLAGPAWSRDREPHVTIDPIGAGRAASAAARRLVGPRAARLYRGTGIDLLTVVYGLAGTRRGQMLERMLRRRTGEQLPMRAELGDMIAWARSRSPSGE
ncbi:MAG: glycosyltransferase [Actinobacteria bacterium]|nr:glycosyltransferase [Actinomycetota bacterium]